MNTNLHKNQADALEEILCDQPIAWLGRQEEITSAVPWLCSAGASFVIGTPSPWTTATSRTGSNIPEGAGPCVEAPHP
jgi:NAD(P)-dependent dehydrogenase (short-subunit alcohol dehydrogenase family)